MPTNSPFPDIPIPATDLWSFIFDRPDRDFSDDKVIYRAVDSSRNHTFADVKRLATTFGQGLLECWNWQKDEVLALYAPNDIDVGPVIYGTLYAGGIVTPANPGYSVDELAYQIKNAGARAVVTTAQFLSTAVSAAEKVGIKKECVIILGGVESKDAQHWRDLTPAKQQGMMKRRTANPQDLAFLAYSSGTTGLPKGVMLSHRNIIADLLIMQHAVGHSYSSSSAKFLGVLPFFHIYGLTGLVHQTLHRGIELVVMPAFDMQVFLKAVQSHKITFVYVAPPVLVRLSRDKMVEGWDLSSLEMITSGAAPLTKELVDAVYKRVGVRINQAYGLSETSPLTHTQPWNEWYTSVGSVGKLFPNMRAKYMSESGTEVAAGTPGELWLSGPNVFKGYWKNEEATRNSLTSDGYFKTGDIGFQDEKHNFYITDRIKELIKYKGFQVPPAELEGKLMENEMVNDVAVIGVEDEERHTEVPRAYVVAAKKGAGEKEAREIVQWMDKKVASHKRLRGGVVFVDEVPKSASGKILRRVLKGRKGDVGLGVVVMARL